MDNNGINLLYERVDDFEVKAAQKISPEAFTYYKLGVDEEQTVRENREAFKRWRFRPRLLQDVSKVETSVQMNKSKIRFPICIAPSAHHKLAHIDGEVATARAAEAMGVGFTLSIYSNCTMEEVAQKAPNCIKWCQLQIIKDRDIMMDLVRRAENCGFLGFIVTIDQPAYGKKRRRTSDGKTFLHYNPYRDENLISTTKRWSSAKTENTFFSSKVDGSVMWADLDWLQSITDLPIMVKGVLTAEMATEVLKHDIDGIIVSNHGGRQLDGVFSTIDSLPEVVKAVNGKCDVYMDGGIRQGSDVVKAIALGAKAVFIGRPALWGLAASGEEGVKKVLSILCEEFVLTMKILGVSSVEELRANRELVVHENWKFSRL